MQMNATAAIFQCRQIFNRLGASRSCRSSAVYARSATKSQRADLPYDIHSQWVLLNIGGPHYRLHASLPSIIQLQHLTYSQAGWQASAAHKVSYRFIVMIPFFPQYNKAASTPFVPHYSHSRLLNLSGVCSRRVQELKHGSAMAQCFI